MHAQEKCQLSTCNIGNLGHYSWPGICNTNQELIWNYVFSLASYLRSGLMQQTKNAASLLDAGRAGWEITGKWFLSDPTVAFLGFDHHQTAKKLIIWRVDKKAPTAKNKLICPPKTEIKPGKWTFVNTNPADKDSRWVQAFLRELHLPNSCDINYGENILNLSQLWKKWACVLHSVVYRVS